MKLAFASSITVATSLGCTTASPTTPPRSGMIYGFETIEPSPNLAWTPCFDDFTCAKLQVPIDYANPSLGSTYISFIKLAGRNATAESPSVLFIPGGPGGSGIGLLRDSKDMARQFFGEQYNIVSFDPRGVNNSGLHLDCFSGNTEARRAWLRLHSTGETNLTTTPRKIEEQYYSASIYGEWCNHAVETATNNSGETTSPHAYYVTTPSVARDLLSFVEAEARLTGVVNPSEARLWAYGVSYGTVVGMTFASMFPGRVGRMVLDGVVNAEGYYHNDWSEAPHQLDQSVEFFVSSCHSAGPEKCAFWGPSPANITARMDAVIDRLRTHPVPISGVGTNNTILPTMVTYTDLIALFLSSIYSPRTVFPAMATILREFEKVQTGVAGGNVSPLANLWDQTRLNNLAPGVDVNYAIRCADSYGRNKITTLDDFKQFIDDSAKRSKYMGDLFPSFIDTVLCRGFRPNLPESMVVKDPISGTQRNTSFPILFTSNTIDGITPLISAQKMSSRFPGSRLLLQDGVGHTVLNTGGSPCYFGYIQAYFQGVLPPSSPRSSNGTSSGNGTVTCPLQSLPFTDVQPLPSV